MRALWGHAKLLGMAQTMEQKKHKVVQTEK